ncbi:MAG TPA: hypothetical protein PLP01_15070 [Phycisphaerae bacterium]|jgi:hypothetical protein|nr:hypothetical protein [Phycisphaerae bacterium]
MSNPFRPVTSGEPFRPSARVWNVLMQLAQAFDGGGMDATGLAALGLSSPAPVVVRNDSGADRDEFDVLGIDGALVLPSDGAMPASQFKTSVAVKGVTPVDPDHLGRFVVLSGPVKAGAIGRGYVSGTFPVKLDVADADHQWAEIDDGSTRLKSCATGSAAILWKESGTGEKWALVRFDCAPGTADDPAVLEPADFEQETAATDEWDITDPPAGKDGVIVRVQTRTAYNDAGDQKLYAFHRDLTFDSRGCLVAATAETRVEVDAPEDC